MSVGLRWCVVVVAEVVAVAALWLHCVDKCTANPFIGDDNDNGNTGTGCTHAAACGSTGGGGDDGDDCGDCGGTSTAARRVLRVLVVSVFADVTPVVCGSLLVVVVVVRLSQSTGRLSYRCEWV